MNKRLLLLLIVIVSFSYCKNDAYTSIPYTNVYLKLDLSFEDNGLNAFYAYKTFTKPRNASDRLGYGGILVINGINWEGNNPVCLYAFDLACPVEVDRNTKVVPDDEGFCKCPKCGTKYNIGNGSGAPVSGTGSKVFLRSYPIIDNGDNVYIVRQ